MQMILMIDRISDTMLYPQRAMQLRQFHDVKMPENNFSFDFTTTADYSDRFPIATFKLEILFRQNASWQGNLIYAENNRSSSFRSVLELLTLIDSALSNL